MVGFPLLSLSYTHHNPRQAIKARQRVGKLWEGSGILLADPGTFMGKWVISTLFISISISIYIYENYLNG
jgi:hypothetical protein